MFSYFTRDVLQCVAAFDSRCPDIGFSPLLEQEETDLTRVDEKNGTSDSRLPALTVLVPICGNRDAYASGQNYVHTLLDEIQKDDRGLQWLIGIEAERITELQARGSQANVRWIPFPKWSSSSVGRLLFEQLRLPSIIRSVRPDVVYFSANFLTLWSSVPSVLSIRSLLYYYYPEAVSRLRLISRRFMTRIAVRKATHIVCPSRKLSEQVREVLAVPEERVTAVLHGTNPIYLDEPDDDSVLDRLGLRDRRYFIYPSSLWEYKNQSTLIRAVKQLSSMGEDVTLVLAGWGKTARASYVESLRSEADQIALPSEVILAGEVSSVDLSALYTHAIALLFPSTCESFGNPIVEAMARGCPVVASNCHALPEIVAGGGTVLDPYDVEAWAGEMSQLSRPGEYRRRQVEQAVGRRPLYRAERAVDELVRVLREAAESEVD